VLLTIVRDSKQVFLSIKVYSATAALNFIGQTGRSCPIKVTAVKDTALPPRQEHLKQKQLRPSASHHDLKAGQQMLICSVLFCLLNFHVKDKFQGRFFFIQRGRTTTLKLQSRLMVQTVLFTMTPVPQV
jgi:hypothetical protein